MILLVLRKGVLAGAGVESNNIHAGCGNRQIVAVLHTLAIREAVGTPVSAPIGVGAEFGTACCRQIHRARPPVGVSRALDQIGI